MRLVEHCKVALDRCWEAGDHPVVHYDGCALWTMPGDDSSGMWKHGGRHSYEGSDLLTQLCGLKNKSGLLKGDILDSLWHYVGIHMNPPHAPRSGRLGIKIRQIHRIAQYQPRRHPECAQHGASPFHLLGHLQGGSLPRETIRTIFPMPGGAVLS